MTRILFVHNGNERFVLLDRAILSERYTVTDRYEQKRLVNPFDIYRDVQSHDLVFGWFASWHTFFPTLFARLLKKPAIVVIGGYDTANLPEAGYGSQRGGMRRMIARSVIHNATHLITNSHSAAKEAVENAGANRQKISVIYHGFPPLPLGNGTTKDNLVITVGGVRRENLLRKGLLPFVQAAAYLPDTKFMLIGKWYDDSIEQLRKVAPPNVEFTGFVSDERLLYLYQRASVYVQASLHEGFGMSVAEAMLAGCIPVVTRVGSLPEVVGDMGTYVENVPQSIANGISRSLLADNIMIMRRRVRERVLSCFPLEKRREELISLVESIRLRNYIIDL